MAQIPASMPDCVITILRNRSGRLFLPLLLLPWIGCVSVDDLKEAQYHLGAEEVYVKYERNSREGQIILYSLQANRNQSDEEIEKLSRSLLHLTEKTSLCKQFYGMDSIAATAESLFEDRGFVKLDIRFRAQAESDLEILDEILWHILKLGGKSYHDPDHENLIMTTFISRKPLNFSSGKAGSVVSYFKEDTANPKYVLAWDTDKGPFELVTRGLFKADSFKPLYPYFQKIFALQGAGAEAP